MDMTKDIKQYIENYNDYIKEYKKRIKNDKMAKEYALFTQKVKNEHERFKKECIDSLEKLLKIIKEY